MSNFNFEKIYNTVLKLEVTKGHLKWTMSDLARFSEQKRSLIYYHCGKDLNVILHDAWSYMLNTMFALNESERLGIRERLKIIVNKVNDRPYLFVLFYLEKRKQTEIGLMIQKCEKLLLANLRKFYPKYTPKDILKIYLCELGAIAYQELKEEEINSIFPK